MKYKLTGLFAIHIVSNWAVAKHNKMTHENTQAQIFYTQNFMSNRYRFSLRVKKLIRETGFLSSLEREMLEYVRKAILTHEASSFYYYYENKDKCTNLDVERKIVCLIPSMGLSDAPTKDEIMTASNLLYQVIKGYYR